MRPIYILSKSSRQDKKFMITTPEGKTIHFGQQGASDYTIHKNLARKNSYTVRHQMNEDWTKSGINTAGFWAKNLLWNKPTLEEAIKDTGRKFGIKIVRE
jgi:hypothetical protein